MVTFVARSVGPWQVQVIALEAQRCVLVHSILPTTVDRPSLTVVTELITHLNSGMILGNFELDHASGTVRFKTSMPVDETPEATTIGRLVDLNVEMMAEHAPTIVSVAHGLPLEVALAMSSNPSNNRSAD
jgi:hypothetical protein